MVFLVAACSELMLAHAVKGGVNAQPQRVKGVAVAVLNPLVYLFKPYTAHTAYGVGEVAVYDLLIYADSLKNLGGLVGLNCGNTHF